MDIYRMLEKEYICPAFLVGGSKGPRGEGARARPNLNPGRRRGSYTARATPAASARRRPGQGAGPLRAAPLRTAHRLSVGAGMVAAGAGHAGGAPEG